MGVALPVRAVLLWPVVSVTARGGLVQVLLIATRPSGQHVRRHVLRVSQAFGLLAEIATPLVAQPRLDAKQ